jgi:HAE1 family hydrophobic/amphiphilic exporter-1
MLENIVRHMEMGKSPMHAAFAGSAEVGFTILSMTISLVAVFIPVLFMGGVVGRMFFEFGVTMSLAILISGVVALTLTPMLASRILSEDMIHEEPNAVIQVFDAFFSALTFFYKWTLKAVLSVKYLMLLVTIGTVFYTVQLFNDIPKGFFPQEDTGQMIARTQGPDDTSFEAMTQRQVQVEKIIRADPDVTSVLSVVGGGGPGSNQTTGFLFMTLKPKDQRTTSANDLIARLRKATAVVPGITPYFQMIQNINISVGASKAQWQYTLQSTSFDDLRRIAPLIEARMRQTPGLQDVSSDLQTKGREAYISIDRDQASKYGLTVDQIRDQLYSAYGTRQVSTIFTEASSYQVILQADDKFVQSPDALRRMTFRSPTGGVVPLDQVARVVEKPTQLLVSHKSQLPAATISFNLAPGVALSDAVTAIAGIERDVVLPTTVTSGYSGTAQIYQDALAGQGLLIFAAILVIYIVLGILYESFIHPITILSGLPSAGIGALLTLKYFNYDLSVIALIGLVMLIGIVKKNAIMIVDFAVERQAQGLSARAAVEEACLLRFRPIMMTSFCAVLGTLPIAVGLGAGAELRQPLGVAVVGGLAFSQLIMLYMTPCIFLILAPFTKPRHIITPEEAAADDLAAEAWDHEHGQRVVQVADDEADVARPDDTHPQAAPEPLRPAAKLALVGAGEHAVPPPPIGPARPSIAPAATTPVSPGEAPAHDHHTMLAQGLAKPKPAPRGDDELPLAAE